MRTALLLAVLLLLLAAGPALAQQPAVVQPTQQQSMRDVLSFLLTNQSVQTGDFVKDRAAAQATSDTVSRALLVDITTMPLASSSGGFTYQFNPVLGTLERRSSTFGPFFVERALGSGANRFTLGLFAQYSRFDRLDGNNLRDNTFVTTANKFGDESQPFDTDTLTLAMNMSTIGVSARYGVANRLDIGAIVPFVSLSLDGQRVNTYRGTSVVQAVASATRMGLGDVATQVKYQAVGNAGSGFAVAADIRLPTGRSEDLLGAGRASVAMLVIGSVESGRVALHMNGGYGSGGVSDELRFSAAAAVAATPHLTIDGEFLGRRLLDVGRVTPAAFPHPVLIGVDTYRLLPSGGTTMPVFLAAGLKWNLVDEWVLDAHVLMPVADAGLTARLTPAIAIERSFGR
jgi:hypothetical protein